MTPLGSCHACLTRTQGIGAQMQITEAELVQFDNLLSIKTQGLRHKAGKGQTGKAMNNRETISRGCGKKHV